MSTISRAEEMVLLAVWRLMDNAYGVSIVDMLNEITDKKWVLGAIYVPLERLEEKGCLTSFMGEPINKRGGRSKRFYKLTKLGLDALIRLKEMEKSIWQDISIENLEKGYEGK
ncbi:PadR family transcriptional regulator [candidate division KSB1 bacterium]